MVPYLLYIFFVNIGLTHDYHVSKTEITYNGEKSRLEITQFLFLDDLNLAFEMIGDEKQHFHTDKQLPSADSVLMAYVNNHLKIYSDDKQGVELHLLGHEISEDLSGLYIYLYSDKMQSRPKTFTFVNSILTEVFDDQTNLIFWTSERGEKSYHVLNLHQNSTTLVNTDNH